MGMTPDQFFITFVRGNYFEFEDNPDVRRGFNAAVAASQMADHYYNYYEKHDHAKVCRFRNLTGYCRYVSRQTGGAFKDIRSIATAFKHLYTEPWATVDSTGAIEAVSLTTTDIAEVAYRENEASDRLTVVFTRKAGERFELLPVLKKIVDFWSEEVYACDDDSSSSEETGKTPE